MSRALVFTGLSAIGEELQQQRCKICWCADGFNFHVPDCVWACVTPPELQGSVVCLRCFDLLAQRAGVDYAGCLSNLHFAGAQTALRFAVLPS